MVGRKFTESILGNDITSEGVSEEVAAIISAALMHVPFDGWSNDALSAGAVDAGIEPERVSACFPGGPVDAIVAYIAMADADMVSAFEALEDKPEKVHLMIRSLVLIRLEQASAHKEAVRRALTVLALPTNAGQSARTLYRTVDAMWDRRLPAGLQSPHDLPTDLPRPSTAALSDCGLLLGSTSYLILSKAGKQTNSVALHPC